MNIHEPLTDPIEETIHEHEQKIITNRFFIALALAGIATGAQPLSAQPPRPRPGPILEAPPSAIPLDPTRFKKPLTPEQQRLHDHAMVLRAFGISDLASLGTLTLSNGALAAPVGLLRPTNGAILGDTQTLSGRRVVSTGGSRSFQPFTAPGRVLLTETSASSPNLMGRAGVSKTTQATIPLNTAYWAANQIQIPADTTIVLAGGTAS